MRSHAPTCTPDKAGYDRATLSSAYRGTSAGAQVHSSYLCSRFSPQRTFLRRLVRPAKKGSISSLKEDASTGRCTRNVQSSAGARDFCETFGRTSGQVQGGLRTL